MTVKVSVIVPVYNVAAYLRRCLESLRIQTLRDIEIIMVNDGSTDQSARIAHQFVKRDPRFRLIEQQNQGLGFARNTGLRHASGEFVSFIDSDDWVDPTMMEAFTLEAERTRADLVVGTFFEVSSNERVVKIIPLEPALRQRMPPFHWSEYPSIFFTPTPVWDKFYRRQIIVDNGISFIKENCEDIDFRWRVFTAAARISVMPDPLYYYRVRKSSLTGGKQLAVDAFRTHDQARAFLKQTGLFDQLRVEFGVREIIEIIYLSFKARSALLNDKAFYTAYYNLTQKAFSQIDFDSINHKFYYISFPYLLLALVVRYHNDPYDYRDLLRKWETLFDQQTARRIGRWTLELGPSPTADADAWAAIEQSTAFESKIAERTASIAAYPDEPTHPAVQFAPGSVSLLPPVTAASGPPAIACLKMHPGLRGRRLFAVVWTYQAERIRTLEVHAELRQGGRPVGPSHTLRMPATRWYHLLALDLEHVDPDLPLDLFLWVEATGPYPMHYTGVRLSHFQVV